MPRVLIVDDFADARDLLSGYLASEGFETEEAVDGEDAIARATERPPDVILMDIAMPNMDGITATQYLRENPRTAAIPVIAVTGQAHHPSLVSPPCDSVLVKPIDPVRVLHEIRRLLGARASKANVLGAARAASLPGRRANAKSAAGNHPAAVWLISPDAALRDEMQGQLRREGWSVQTFASVEETRGHPSEIDVDAVVVDVEVPFAIEWTLELRGRVEFEHLVIIGLESSVDGFADEVRPLFDALVQPDAHALAGALHRALSLRDPNLEDTEVAVEVGDPIFESVEGNMFGTVLEVRREFLMVAVHCAGAFVVPASAVVSAEKGRIVVDPAECEDELRRAIATNAG